MLHYFPWPFLPASRRLLFLGLSAFALASCSHKDEVKGTLVTRNDFESVQGWGGADDVNVSTDRAHSGQYAVRVGPENEFGYTYIRTLGKMSPSKIKEVTVAAWVWLPNAQSGSQLVLSINNQPEHNPPVFYGALDLPKAVTKYKEWQHVSQTFALPDSVQAHHLLKCYLWRSGAAENVFADDITISIGN